MPEQTTQFRAALHGYNREDVVAYIDRMTTEHETAMRRLQEKNDQLSAELAEANEALAAAGENRETEKALLDAQTLISDLRTRNGELENRLAALEDELETAKTSRDDQSVPMTVTQDLTEPIPPVAEVLPVDIAPSKDYTELELAAYRRAELTERMARERAGDIYRQVQSVFNQANERLDTGKSDLEQLSRSLTEDVNQLLNLLTGLNSAYQQAEVSFGEIGMRNRQIMEGEC